ncbi:MAG: SLBB domain-containing protein [Candidatus Izemoplasmatales bacterium]|jgi:competence protein ComEA|nr:SLBB domain-containing protein [Candidatus Izemoplasmatales bacterium]
MLAFIKRFSGFFLLVGGIVGLIVVNIVSSNNQKNAEEETPTTEIMTSTNDGYLVVDIKGAITTPGVYRVVIGSRIQDVIEAADGLLENADLSMINAASIVTDEMVIFIPKKEQEYSFDDLVCIDIKGQVVKPGIYWLPAGSRVGDVLSLAGGVTAQASIMNVNLAEIISDEMVIYVPSIMDMADVTSTSVINYGYVQIKGAVVKPGLYYVRITSTIKDVINLAGGLTFDASTANLDVSKTVLSGMTITVLTDTEVEALNIDDPDTTDMGLIDINTATLAELDTLYGIGSVLAQAIIDYRAENGDFASIEAIMLVSGIKESVYENIKDDITV